MEDIIEKLRLIDYETNFVKKYKKQKISKFFFASNLSQNKPVTPNHNNPNENINIVQFTYFFELCYWLIAIIKQVRIFNYRQELNIKRIKTRNKISQIRQNQTFRASTSNTHS